jgi:SAM-dependent methyltransferase
MNREKQGAAIGRVNYGIDAPDVVRNLAIGGVVSAVVGVALYAMLFQQNRILAGVSLAWTGLSGLPCLIAAGYMIWSSKVGKLFVAERVLEVLAMRGDEAVLDVGCGRGLMLIRAARRLHGGRAVGIDMWRSEDQLGNCPGATRRNARAEGVIALTELVTGDARHLPFKDSTFDVVISSLVLHNIDDKLERETAVREIARVLRSGGRVVLVDFRHTEQYEQVLREGGVENPARSKLHFTVYPPVRMVVGSKS